MISGMGKVTDYKSSILILLAIIAVYFPISSRALSTVDPNGCTIVISYNQTGTAAFNGERNLKYNTTETCLQFCIDLVSPTPCIAVEFSSNKSVTDLFGCWVHTNPEDLNELFNSDPWTTHYQIVRPACPVTITKFPVTTTKRVGEANVETPANSAARLNLAQMTKLVAPVMLLFRAIGVRCQNLL